MGGISLIFGSKIIVASFMLYHEVNTLYAISTTFYVKQFYQFSKQP